jgi:hypothetical protein
VIDVKKAQADVRAAELENIRFAARLLAEEHEDPTIEKKVVVEGGQSVLVSDLLQLLNRRQLVAIIV